MKKLLILLAVCTVCVSFAQRIPADTIQQNNEMVLVQPLNHAALVLSWNEQTIYVDPSGDFKKFEGLKKPDLILITDIHGDHLDTALLRQLDLSAALIVVPSAVAALLPADMKKNLNTLQNGKSVKIKGLNITAVPMYNLPETADSRHPRGRGNGYLVDSGKFRVYISGDTEDIQEMRELRKIDLAFVCMNLPYTMNVEQAAEAVKTFEPRIVYPYHYRGKDGLSDVGRFKELVNTGNKKTEVRLRDWYAE